MSDDYTHGDNVADHDYVIEPPLIKRLRRVITVDGLEMPGNDFLHHEAADALDAKNAEIERLEFACRHNANYMKELDDSRKEGLAEIEDLNAQYNWLKSELRENARIIGEQQEEIERLKEGKKNDDYVIARLSLENARLQAVVDACEVQFELAPERTVPELWKAFSLYKEST